MTQDTPLLPDGSNPEPAAQAEHKPSPELAALMREARGVDGEPQAAQDKQAGAVALSMSTQNRGELAAVLRMARDAALPLIALRSERKAVMLTAIWSDETLEAIAKSGAEVLALHGVALSRLTAGFGPYVALALALGPAAVGTVAVLRAPDPAPAEVVS